MAISDLFNVFNRDHKPTPRLTPVMVVSPELLAEPRATNNINDCLAQIKAGSEFIQAHLRVTRAHIDALEAHSREVATALGEALNHELAEPEFAIGEVTQQFRDDLVATAKAMAAEPTSAANTSPIIGTTGSAVFGHGARRAETLKASPAAIVNTQAAAAAKLAEVSRAIREAPTPSQAQPNPN